jgi:hypothetical protein
MTGADRVTWFFVRWLLNIGALMLIAMTPLLVWRVSTPGVTFVVASIIGGLSALAARPLNRSTPLLLLVNALLYWIIVGTGLLNPLLGGLAAELVYGGPIAANATGAIMAAVAYGIVTLLTSFAAGSDDGPATEGEAATPPPEVPKS